MDEESQPHDRAHNKRQKKKTQIVIESSPAAPAGPSHAIETK